jgi:hypothetical protein
MRSDWNERNGRQAQAPNGGQHAAPDNWPFVEPGSAAATFDVLVCSLPIGWIDPAGDGKDTHIVRGID